MQCRSHGLLLVVLELKDERLDVLALRLPLGNALLSIRVEVLLLLVEQRLVVERLVLIIDEVFLGLRVLLVGLLLEIVRQLDTSLTLFLALLLLSDGELLVTQLPELGEFELFSPRVGRLPLFTIYLVLAALLNGLLHFGTASLLLLEGGRRLGLGLSHLLIEHLFLLIAHLHEILDLAVHQCLLDLLLVGESFGNSRSLKMLERLLLSGVLLDAAVLFLLLEGNGSLHLDQVLVRLLELFAHSNGLLSAFKFLRALTLELLVDLLLNELTLELFLLELLDVAHLEVLELILHQLGVRHLLLVFFLELFAQSLVILLHLLLLEVLPLEIDLLLQGLLSGLGRSLHLLLSSDIAHEHLGVQSLDLVLVVVEHLVGLVELLLAQLLLIFLLFGINTSSLNLIVFKLLDTLIFLALSLGDGSVGPLGHASKRLMMKSLSLILTHGLIVLPFVRLRAHALDALKLIVGDLNGVLG